MNASVVLYCSQTRQQPPAPGMHASTIATANLTVHPLVYDGGAEVLKRLRTCTKLEPRTTTRKNPINTLETGNSSSCSAALPIGTLPRLLMFLSNLEFRLRILRGRGCEREIRWERLSILPLMMHTYTTVWTRRRGECKRVTSKQGVNLR
jgi:hypothetical protein